VCENVGHVMCLHLEAGLHIACVICTLRWELKEGKRFMYHSFGTPISTTYDMACNSNKKKIDKKKKIDIKERK
jgi:hypothetical protein